MSTYFCTKCLKHDSVTRCKRCDDLYCQGCNDPESATCQHLRSSNIWGVYPGVELLLCDECGGDGHFARGGLVIECKKCTGAGAVARRLKA